MAPDHIHAVATTSTPLDVDETLAGKELLVTGVTGFLGKVWVCELLCKTPDVGHLYLLIRGQRRTSALDRFRRIAERSPAFRPLREAHGDGLGAFLRERVTVLDGDVSRPLCGFDDATVSMLAPRLDAIVHFAGLTDFNPDPVQAMDINTRGAEHIADLLGRCKGARLVHCSTCYVAGTQSGHVPEHLEFGVSPNGSEFDPHAEVETIYALCAQADAGFEDTSSREARKARLDAVNERGGELGWPNVYTFSKGLAEQLLLDRGVPLTIVRPAIVECAETFPFAGWNEGINTSGPLIWFLGGPWQYLPCSGDNHFDVVPVDTVSRATTVVLAAHLRGEAELVYQLGSSQTNPLCFDRAIELNNLSVRRHFRDSDRKPVERLLFRFLDSRPRPNDDQHLLSVPSVQRIAGKLKGLMARVDLAGVAPPALRPVAEKVHGQRDWAVYFLNQAEKKLGKLNWMLDMYQPFISDNDYVFATDNIRALGSGLTDEARDAWGWDLEALDWRHYWMEVMYPGINKWTMPLLAGARAAEDPAPARPLDLTGETLQTRRAAQAVS